MLENNDKNFNTVDNKSILGDNIPSDDKKIIGNFELSENFKIEDFYKYAENIGVSLTTEMIDKFNALYLRLVEENEKFNLTTITEKNSVYLLHFLDSLSASPYIPENASIADICSGGGFPALPILIARPDVTMTMLDSVNKKVIYLNDTVKLLKLHKAMAIHARIEDVAKGNMRESFQVVTARAVAKLPTLAEYALPLVKINGVFIAYKSNAEEELSEAKNAIKVLGGAVEKVIDVNIASDVKRTLIVVRKVKRTPNAYPRGKNRERLSPIL